MKDATSEQQYAGQLEATRNHIEKLMLEMDPNASDENHKHYLAGVVDTFADMDEINEEQREILYAQYCF
jgi:hypothetical protein